MKKLIYFTSILFLSFIIYLIYPAFNLYLKKDKKEIICKSEKITLKITEDIFFNEIGDLLVKNNILKYSETFDRLVEFKEYKNEILKKGKYVIKKKWSNNTLVNQLFLMRNLNLIDLYIPSAMNLEIISGKISTQIGLDSIKILEIFNDYNIQKNLGFNSYTFPSIIIPNTYEVFANISEQKLIDLLAFEYKKFWNNSRLKKAKNLGLTQSEICILASIVQMEQQVKFDEHSKIAGLYINRLKRNMKLQADPTVKFALKNPSLRRLYYKHLEFDSPYNTYKYKGIPPGPICIPDPRVIDAVLNYSQHDYIFMCAKPSYSGYHNFSSSNADHEKFKKMYITWLNLEKIN